jgi:hypothetical protein
MKYAFLILCFLGQFVPTHAQVPVKNQPGADWYKLTQEMHRKKKIAGDSLLKMKQAQVPEHFQDTLRQYDWIDLGSYLYVDKAYSVHYNKFPEQYHFFRLGDGDTTQNFSWADNQIIHTMFRANYAMQPVYTVKKIANLFWIELNYGGGSKEYLKILAYKNGVLVLDTPMNGKTSDKKFFSRTVFMARKKTFHWNINEN